MDPDERLARFEAALEALIEANGSTPVVVEGVRDRNALRELGLAGEILVYNQGTTMAGFVGRLPPRERLILFFDWDRKGGQLSRLLQQTLGGAVALEVDLRREFGRVSLVKCVEDLPSAWRTLRRRAGQRAPDEA